MNLMHKSDTSPIFPDAEKLPSCRPYAFLPFAVRYDTKQVRIPAENTYSYGSAYLYGAEQSVLEVDFAANEQIIQDEVFSDKK